MGKTKRKLKTETMSDDCFFNPAACEEPAAEEPPKEDGRMDEDKDGDDMEKEMDMTPQIAFLMTAFGATAFSALDLFWRKHAILSEQYTSVADSETGDLPYYYGYENALVALDGDYGTDYTW